ncbi:hypothetical protein [Pelagibacterium sp.]|uniref:hypothetical protein n=1 Tax=Pelagibacterium sp. TaxID=1967288 RepID=UPI003A956EE2
MEIAGFIISIIGVGISAWALWQADYAKKAVDRVILKGDEQRDRDKARELSKILGQAKSAALGRRRTASRPASAGRDMQSDLHMLEQAQDALATTKLVNDASISSDLDVAAMELKAALVAIHQNGKRDGWEDAFGALQVVIPKVELFERDLARKALQ